MRVALVCSGRPDNLKYLKNNRDLVYKTLNKYGWKVQEILLQNISSLNTVLEEYRENNIVINELLFFYTGHGSVDNRQEIFKLQLIDKSEVDINDILDSIFKYINPNKQIIILDACYSATLTSLKLELNVEFLFSSKSNQQSYEDEKLEHSIFSYYFCEAIENMQGQIKLNEIEKYIFEKNKRQEPKHVGIGNHSLPSLDKLLKQKIYFNNHIEKEKINKIYNKKYLLILLVPILILLDWNEIFPKNKKGTNPTTILNMKNQSKILIREIENLLVTSDTLISESENYNDSLTIQEEIEEEKDFIRQKSIKYRELNSIYSLKRKEYNLFIKSYGQYEFSLEEIKKIDEILIELEYSIKKIARTINIEKNYLQFLKNEKIKRRNKLKQISEDDNKILKTIKDIKRLKNKMIGEENE